MALDARIQELLAKVKARSFPLELPSNGKLGYPKEIEIRAYSHEEEKYLYTMDKNNAEFILDKVLNSLIVKPEDLTVDRLSEPDRLAVLIFARMVSYMEKHYTFRVYCPSCGKAQPLRLELETLRMKLLEEDLTEPRLVDLPILGIKVALKYPVHSDHLAADKYVRNYNRMVEQNNKAGSAMEELDGRVVRYANQIQAIHFGKKEVQAELSIQDKLEFYQSLEGADLQVIRDWADQFDHGYLMETTLTCKYCKEEEVVDLPVDRPFLFPAI